MSIFNSIAKYFHLMTSSCDVHLVVANDTGSLKLRPSVSRGSSPVGMPSGAASPGHVYVHIKSNVAA